MTFWTSCVCMFEFFNIKTAKNYRSAVWKQFNAFVCSMHVCSENTFYCQKKNQNILNNRALGQYLRVKKVNTEQFHANVEHLATLSYKMTISDR